MGILISEVRIRNFHSLHSVDVPLGEVTLLTGAINAGKTSFLRALYLSLGIGKRIVSKEDIYVAPKEKLPRSRQALIDILIVPMDDETGKKSDSFNDMWREYFGNNINMDASDQEFVAIRTKIKYDVLRDYYLEQFSLDKWTSDLAEASEKNISHISLEKVPLYYIDAQRDISEDIKDRSSYWGRLVSDVGLTEKQISKIEKQLNKINAEIVSTSDVLSHMKIELDKLNSVVSQNEEGVHITPLTRKIRDLNRGMDVHFQDGQSEAFPISQHGMGTRSWAALLIFRAYTSWLLEISQKSSDSPTPLHPLLALEEPEAHLHPHGQRHVFQQIQSLMGQKIVSTHSPYIASMANVFDLRHFSKKGSCTTIRQLNIADFDEEAIRKLKREVLNTRGEILFARAIVLFEGETEEEALPIFAEYYWGVHPHELGISFIGVGGAGKYLPFLRLAKNFNIPWFIFSDGEPIPLRDMRSALRQAKEKEDNRVVIIPNNGNFEKYLIDEGYSIEIQEVFKEQDLKQATNERHRRALEARWKPMSDSELLLKMKGCKTQFAPSVANKLCMLPDEERRLPSKVRELLEIISATLSLQPRG